jgi:hypothetical protein
MPKPQTAPLTQIENVTLALAQWLRDEGFSPEPTDTIDPEDPKAEERIAYRKSAECVYYCADAAAIRDEPRAIAVLIALGYLLGTVLREHHREVHRARLEADFGPDDPRLLAFSRTRTDLGHAVRKLIGPIAHMGKMVRQWEAERRRWEQLGFPQGDEDVRTATRSAGQERGCCAQSNRLPSTPEFWLCRFPGPWKTGLTRQSSWR